MKDYNLIIDDMNLHGLFVSNEFTYTEYVDQLHMLQDYIVKRVYKDKFHPIYRIDDALYQMKQEAIKYELTDLPEFRNASWAMKVIEKQISISASGKRGEDRVSNHLTKYIDRDYVSFKGVYLTDGVDETEVDNLILTKNGLLLLEVKNIKSNVTITSEGRLVIGNDASYDKRPIVESMKLKRKLLRNSLQKTLTKKGYDADIVMDSYIVFTTPHDTRYHINNYSSEKVCTSKKLPYIINDYVSDTEYSDTEFNQIKECLSELEVNLKRFKTDVDFQMIKEHIAKFISMIEEQKELEIEEKQRLATQAKMQQYVKKRKSLSRFSWFELGALTLCAVAGAVIAGMDY